MIMGFAYEYTYQDYDPSLFGRNWPRVVKLDWAQFNKVSGATNDRLEGILRSMQLYLSLAWVLL